MLHIREWERSGHTELDPIMCHLHCQWNHFHLQLVICFPWSVDFALPLNRQNTPRSYLWLLTSFHHWVHRRDPPFPKLMGRRGILYYFCRRNILSSSSVYGVFFRLLLSWLSDLTSLGLIFNPFSASYLALLFCTCPFQWSISMDAGWQFLIISFRIGVHDNLSIHNYVIFVYFSSVSLSLLIIH